MRIINQSFEILASIPNLEKLIEQAGRVCWKSEERICEGSEKAFITGKSPKSSVLQGGDERRTPSKDIQEWEAVTP